MPLTTTLAPEAGALRDGARWVPDTFVPLAMSRAVRAAALLLAAEVDATGRKAALSEKGTRTWLASHRDEVVAAGNEAVRECWSAVGGRTQCPVEVLGFGTTLKQKQRPDDLVVRYRIGDEVHRMWINHKEVKSSGSGLSRVGTIRAATGAVVGDRLSRWEQVVPALAEALGTGRHLASLVLVLHDTDDGVEVSCYEPFTVFAYWDRQPLGGVVPDSWPRREGKAVAAVYSRENSLVQAAHRAADEVYPTLALGLVAAGVATTEVVRRGAGRMFEHDAFQRRLLAIEADARLAAFVAAVGYEPELPEAEPEAEEVGPLALLLGGQVRPPASRSATGVARAA